MTPLNKEDKIFQEIFEELKKFNFDFDNCTFYQDDEGNTIYIIQNKNIPKPIKLIVESEENYNNKKIITTERIKENYEQF